MQKVLLLPGDGVGPTLMDCAEQVITVAVGQVEIVRGDIGFDAYERTGDYLPSDTVELMHECGSTVCGPLKTYKDSSGRPLNLLDSLRKSLDLYAVARPFVSLHGTEGAAKVSSFLWGCNTSRAFDVSEVRDIEGMTLSKFVSSSAYVRMMSRALSFLEQSGCRKVECITRDDLFPDSSGMFAEAFDVVFGSGDYELSHSNIQEWASRVVRDPSRYQYLVCADLYMQVAAGILAGLTGGNHLFPIGFMGDSTALVIPGLAKTFEGVTEESLNPTSVILASSLALRSKGMAKEADAIVSAICQTYEAGDLTKDLGGSLTAHEFTDIVASRL